MGLLRAPPKSFKIDRKSQFASNLKSLISDKLLRLCPDYSDDVLAEYITVLVCNGKNQNQARDDLEAFLGERTHEFVSWLWKLLLNNELQLTTVVSLDPKDKNSHFCDTDRDKANVNGTFRDLQSQANSDSVNLLGEYEENYCSSRQACKSNDMATPKDQNHQPPKQMIKSVIQSSILQSKLANGDSSEKVPSLVRKNQTKRVDGFKKTASLLQKDDTSILEKPPASLPGQHPASVTHSFRQSKLSDEDPAYTERHPASLPGRTPTSGTHPSHSSKLSEIPHMHYAENSLERSVSPQPLVPSSQINKPRRSVWDRLGKPLQDVSSGGQIADCVMDKAQHNEERIDPYSPSITKHAAQIGRLSPLLSAPSVQGSRNWGQVHRIAEDDGANNLDDRREAEHVETTGSQVLSVSNIGRKRHFSEVNDHTDAGVATEKRADNPFEKVNQSHKRSDIPLEASQAVVPQVNDVKLRLHQIEVEMNKLRSKQIMIEKKGKANLLTNSGVVKPTEEDVGSRTVLVTNVHFKATKETLSMYFRKCGAIVNVVMLTGKPLALERSAYITFESKEAADKALGFSGTSFYSRSIMVSRKGEMPNATTAPAQFSGKKLQISHSKNNLDPNRFSFSGSRLQWRRESLSSSQSEPLSPSTCDQTKAALESACQQEPSPVPVSEVAGYSKQCPVSWSDQIEQSRNIMPDQCAAQQEHQT